MEQELVILIVYLFVSFILSWAIVKRMTREVYIPWKMNMNIWTCAGCGKNVNQSLINSSHKTVCSESCLEIVQDETEPQP